MPDAKRHRADAYCPVCGGACRDLEAILRSPEKPFSLGPLFTGSGAPSFRPSRKAGRFD